MGQAMQFPLVGGAYQSRSLALDAQRCVNFYPVLGESGTAKAVRALFGTPGLRRLATLDGAGGLRALYRPSTGDAIAVRGSTVYRVAKDWTFRQVGALDTDTGPVSIADDGQLAVLVTGAAGYTLGLDTDAFRQIVDEAFYGADYVAYSKTVFVFNRPGTRQFYLSTAGVSGVQLDATDFASATSNGENLVRQIVNNEDLILFKRTKAEIWRAVTGGDFLFARDMNAVIEKGCEAAGSVVSMDNTVYWLGGDESGAGIVWRLDGYTPERVSHAGLEYAIQNYATTADAQAWTYQQEGHTFYVLTFPSAGATWCYDAATQLWHERAYLNPRNGRFTRHRAACHMHYAGVHVVGDWEDGRLYALDLDYFTDDGDPLVALRAAPHIAGSSYNEIRFNRITVDMETGVGLVDGVGSDPVLMLRWSNDGGRTWGALQSLPMGRLGEYGSRVTADRLGMARDRVFEVSISDPVKRAIMGAAVDAVDLGR